AGGLFGGIVHHLAIVFRIDRIGGRVRHVALPRRRIGLRPALLIIGRRRLIGGGLPEAAEQGAEEAAAIRDRRRRGGVGLRWLLLGEQAALRDIDIHRLA